MPGGVNSPVRAMGSIGRDPVFIERGEGARVWDADGKAYVDWVSSWGPLILGHAHPAVVEAVTAAAANGTSYGAATEGEVDLAAEVADRFASVEMLRMTSSGTEAAMSAIRLARAATGREKLVKFAGAYHGHVDGLLAEAGSGLATAGIPSSPGVPEAAAAATVIVPWNDAEAVEAAVTEHSPAAILAEPVPANMGVVPPEAGFLERLRELADSSGALLVLDEVISGFRVARGGAQELLGVPADITVMGKVIGGGLPAAAYGGSAELMQRIAPAGDVYQAGTLSGNPLAVAAGLATLARAGRVRLRTPRRDDRAPRERAPGGGRRASRQRRHRARARHRLLLRVRLLATSPVPPRATPMPTAASAGRCSSGASTRPRRSSRPGSRRWPTTTRRSSRRSPPRPNRSRRHSNECRRSRDGGIRMSVLGELAAELRREEAIAPHVRESDEPPALGALAAAGPRAAEAPDTYLLLFEAIREGYLLHYGEPRLLEGAEPDLKLLAGDYLYALGLERLAAQGDLEAIRELGDLISLSAQLHARSEEETVGPLWIAAAVAVGGGSADAHERAKAAARAGDPEAAELLASSARSTAASMGFEDAMAEAAESII